MVRVIKSPYLSTPQLLDVDGSKVHPLVWKLFHVKTRQAPPAGRLKFSSENWEKITQDVNILFIVHSFKILFSQTPFQYGTPQLARVNQDERLQINSEIKELLRKAASQLVESETWEFLSKSAQYSCLNVKDLLARNRHDIWSLSDSNRIRTLKHLLRKRTLNHLAKWLSCVVSTYLSGAFDCMLLSCHVLFQSESALYSCLNVKELVPRNKRDIWTLSDSNGTW